jgi:uncharacterized phiE125 gp8 family phage protein
MRWHLEQVEKPDASLDPLVLASVRADHLRVTNTAENDYIAGLIRTSDRMAERTTRRAHLTQTWALVLSRFPYGCDPLLMPRPPLQAIESITYIDADGAEQTWSSALYEVSSPSGPEAGFGSVAPAYDEIWPVTRFGIQDAVTVTFRAGYPEIGSPATCDVPEDITHGRLLVIAEMYKQRSESMASLSPAMIRARDLWMGYRVYGA